MKIRVVTEAVVFLAILGLLQGADTPRETLPGLVDGHAPESFEQLWKGFDPRAEPLETETLKEWEDGGVVLRVVRFRIGVFKGRTARLAAVYGFPKSMAGAGKRLPGLLQIHGGGQYADHRACLLNAKRGYATLSIAWAGRISAPGYRVSPKEVKLFWGGKTEDPAYKLTTDWGAVDGYHAPSRNPGNVFPSARSAAWTLDAVESPRNSGWFLCALAARRALTFLERQPEVDPARLGVYGHSMGGKLTVMTAAADSRVRAAAPSCGGTSDRHNSSALYRATIGDDVYLQHVSCPILFLNPANDFHARINDLPRAIREIGSAPWRVSCSPHHNHQDTPEYMVCGMLWLDQWLKGGFKLPATPQISLQLKTPDRTPRISVRPDASLPILSVDFYYTQEGQEGEERQDAEHRFWHHAAAQRQGDASAARLPVHSPDKPLWVFANVTYRLEHPVAGAGYYYRPYSADTFVMSSLMEMVPPRRLRAAGVRAALKPSLLIEDFAGDWQKQWFTYKPGNWARTTHKLHDAAWRAPDPQDARLVLDVQSDEPNTLVVAIDGYAAEAPLAGRGRREEVVLRPRDFRDFDGNSLAGWDSARRFKLCDSERLRPERRGSRDARTVGGKWRGPPPRFRSLRWDVSRSAQERASSSPILDVFPEPVAQVPPDRRGKTTFSSRYTPSGSVWDERLDERNVFQMEVGHRQDRGNSFALRLGKGGQVYSLRGPFGESVPPSWRAPDSPLSPWNDEVWQFVAVCTKYNGVAASRKAGPLGEAVTTRLENCGYGTTFFIHDSGAYIPSGSKIGVLYCPLLASEVRPDQRCFRMLNWGLVPQIKTVHRSPLLYYTQVRDVGDGIIELTWVVHNFAVRDDIVFDHLNAPWGGTRISSLPLRYVSSPDGRLLRREDILNRAGVVEVRKTGGWNLSCASESDDSPSLALVFGRDKNWEAERARAAAGEPCCQFKPSLYRDWRAAAPLYKKAWRDWRTRPANSFRNYDVCEVIPKLRLSPGTTIWYRSFLVVNRRDKAIDLARRLVDDVDYGLLRFAPEATPMVRVAAGGTAFKLFAHPVNGTRPLFSIQNVESGREIVTTDPYYFVKKNPLDFQLPPSHPHHDYYQGAHGYSLDEHHSRWRSLLGFACEGKPEGGSWQRLSKLLPSSRFPKPNRYHLDVWVQVTGQESRSGVPARGAASVEPAKRWEFAFVSGNGRMGAMVFGHPTRETIVGNHCRLFLPLGSREEVPDLARYLPELRRIIRKEGYRKAMDFLLGKAKDQGFPGLIWTDPFHPGFFLDIAMPHTGEIRDYVRTEDFTTGEVAVSWRDDEGAWRRRLFVSRPHNAIVLSITGPGRGAVDCRLIPKRVGDRRIDSELRVESARVSYHNTYVHGKGGFDSCIRVIHRGGTAAVKSGAIAVDGADEVLLFMRIEPWKTPLADSEAFAYSPKNPDFSGDFTTDRRGEIGEALAALPSSYAELFDAHAKVHGELFNRVTLDVGGGADRFKTSEDLLDTAARENRLPAALLEKMYDAGRYTFICSAGELTPNLQGIWTGTWRPSWSGDFTTDTNVELAIKVGFAGNLCDLLDGYFRLIESAVVDWRLNAKRYFGCRGVLAPPRMSNVGLMLHWGRWDGIFWTAGAGWLAHFFMDYYHFTGDREFLAKRVVPLLKEVVVFYEDFVLTDGRTGKYEFIPSYSPECGSGITATMDVAVMREAVTSLIAACEILKIEEGNLPRWKEMLTRLPPYRINGDGALAEFVPAGYGEHYRHRHLSHLYAAFEANGELTPDGTPALWKAAQEATRRRINSQGEQSTHGRMHMGLAAAYLHMAEEAYGRLAIMATKKSMYPSLICSHEPGQSIFNTDGNGAIPEIVHRMLLGSRPGILDLLPALPAALPRGSIRGMLARGQIRIDRLQWDKPAGTIRLELTSGRDQTITLRVPGAAALRSVDAAGAAVARSPRGANARRVSLKATRHARLVIEF